MSYDLVSLKPLAEWPLAERQAIAGVLTDIDDTLTTHGRLDSGVLAALESLRGAGLKLIAVTGRPTWWAMPLLRLCAFDAVIAENGASAFWLEDAGRQQALFYADAATRGQHRRALEALAEELQARFPGLQVADDAAQRVGDLAFDIGENIAPLPAEAVEEIAAFVRGRGFFVATSSIHLHASVVRFSKQETTQQVLEKVFGIGDEAARAGFAFVGDSANDAPMFSHYPNTIGVANVQRFLPRLPKAPVYVTRQASGAGFIEVAQALLEARQ
ncbi:hypothetical protein SAMN06265795_105131 [Noviherbaspirillum humi]|uniref:Sucrose phosphatase-like domain-containing protein n=1 Tax=Noviherbaspirillum humi TaxID=1688639 RepID=A0A239GR65_9BURK|nr:HAD-IIB family hydrolase [Noviherbaspirillum humi]SNS71003.1 hypothetical protein SAMN06265795_105131 [Noviherbaspirillum humi]